MVKVGNLAVTSTNNSFDCGTDKTQVTIKNIGSYSCYINLNAAATVEKFRLDPFEELVIGLRDIATVQAICDTAETTTLSIVASEDTWTNYLWQD